MEKLQKHNPPLLALYKLIKKTLQINTQSLFYNILFTFIEYDFIKKNIKNELSKLFSNPDYVGTDDCNKFMKNFSNCINQYNNASNVNNIFKNKRSLPITWRNPYYQKNNNSEIYTTTLACILQYYLVFISLDDGKYITLKQMNPRNFYTYTEYFSLDQSAWIELNYCLNQNKLTFTEINNFYSLADVIFNTIFEQHNQRLGLTKNNNIDPNYSQYQSLYTHLEFYHNNVSCYGTKLVDRFNILKEYADTNVYCANELAEIYYYGDTFYSVTLDNTYEIHIDYDKAKKYYEKCINNVFLPVACWSLGYMYYAGKLKCDSYEESIEKARECFLRCEGYPAALNSLGNIEREYADKLFDYKKGLSTYSKDETATILNHYKSFLDYTLASIKRNYIFGYINLYDFFFLKKNKEIIDVLKKEPNFPSIDYLQMLKKAADLGNPWSMDRLACHYIAEYLHNHLSDLTITLPDDISVENLIGMINSGEISLKNLRDFEFSLLDTNITSAEEYLLKASSLNYDRAKKHLEWNY